MKQTKRHTTMNRKTTPRKERTWRYNFELPIEYREAATLAAASQPYSPSVRKFLRAKLIETLDPFVSPYKMEGDGGNETNTTNPKQIRNR